GSLDKIKCPVTTPTKDCFKFPIIVYNVVDGNGRVTFIHQVAFLLVVLRDHFNCDGNKGCEFNFEFVDEWVTGTLGTDPGTGHATIHGVQLCGGNYGTTIDEKCDV